MLFLWKNVIFWKSIFFFLQKLQQFLARANWSTLLHIYKKKAIIHTLICFYRNMHILENSNVFKSDNFIKEEYYVYN